MNETIINGIDVSECKNFSCGICEEESKIPRTMEHFTTDCISYPNCLFKQFKRLQEENKELKDRNANLRLNLATYDLPEVKKVLTDWRTGELDKKFKKLQEENKELKEKIDIYENSIIANHDRAVGKRLMEVLLALEEIKSLFDATANGELKTFNEIDAGKIILAIRKRVNEVLK